MGFFGVTSAVFLLGLAGAAIPVIIHLIHRRRAPRVYFATLRFLALSSRRTARRRRLHNLLILALRMLVMAVFAIACAGPFLRSGALGSGPSGAAVAIVLDNSLSMAAREQGTTRYEVAKGAATALLNDLGERDLCVVFFAVAPPSKEAPKLSNDIEALRNSIATSRPLPGVADLARTTDEAQRLLRDSGFARRELYVLTDMQERSWEGARSQPREGDRLPPVVVLNCAETEVRNLAIGEVSVVARAMVVGAPLTVRATVRNGSPRNEQEVVELFLGQEKRGALSLSLAPYEEKQVQFMLRLERPGAYWGRVSLRGDDLPGDDVGFFTVNVAEALPALLVKQSVHPIEFLDDGFFLTQALNPYAGELVASPTGITPEQAMLADLTPETLRRYPVTFLLNTGDLDEEQARMFREYVAAGNSLVIFLGDRVDADRFNRLLGGGEEGLERLLPAELAPPRGDAEGRTRFFRVSDVVEDHAVFDPLRGGPGGLYEQVHVYRFFPATVPAGGGRVLAWMVNSGERWPFCIEGRYGHGRCVLIVTGATAAWSNFPVTTLFLPLMANTVHYLVGEASQMVPLHPGVPRRFVFPARQGPVAVDVTDPAGRTTHLAAAASDQEMVFRDTYQTGIYRFRTGESPVESGYFAVNPEPEESDLRAIEPDELRGRLPQFELYFPGSLDELETVVAGLRQPYQLGAIMFWMLLLVAISEGILANRVTANIRTSKEQM